MEIVGILLIVAVVLWLLFVTLPYLWWLWVLLIGGVLIAWGQERKEAKEKEKLNKPKEREEKEQKNEDEDGEIIKTKWVKMLLNGARILIAGVLLWALLFFVLQ